MNLLNTRWSFHNYLVAIFWHIWFCYNWTNVIKHMQIYAYIEAPPSWKNQHHTKRDLWRYSNDLSTHQQPLTSMVTRFRVSLFLKDRNDEDQLLLKTSQDEVRKISLPLGDKLILYQRFNTNRVVYQNKIKTKTRGFT